MAPREYRDTAGALYAELIQNELADEWQRKSSIEQRGQSVLTTVSVIATVMFGVASFAKTATGANFSLETQAFVWLGVVFLMGAAVLGIRANWPLTYSAAATSELARLVKREYWDAAPMIGSMRSAEVRIEEIARARATNGNKAWALAWGMALLVLGITMLALGVAFAVAGSAVDSRVLVVIAFAVIGLPIVAGAFGFLRAIGRWFGTRKSLFMITGSFDLLRRVWHFFAGRVAAIRG